MPETLLQTKLHILPLRPNLVPRPHLVEKLNQGLHLGHKLTLVSAPAGFGKTTLVSEWLAMLPAGLLISKPQLCICSAWYLFASGRQDAAEERLQDAEKTLNASIYRATETWPMKRDQPADNDRRKIQGRAAAIRAYIATYREDIPDNLR